MQGIISAEAIVSLFKHCFENKHFDQERKWKQLQGCQDNLPNFILPNALIPHVFFPNAILSNAILPNANLSNWTVFLKLSERLFSRLYN